MPVSSAIVKINPVNFDRIRNELNKLKGVEIHKLNNSTVIVVIEAETVEQEFEIAKKISKVNGVISFNITYHSFEDDA